MAHITPPRPDQLPSVRRLVWSALAVLLGAAFLIVAVVLPAERGVDPTGLGRMIGLTEMGIIKQEVNAEFAAESTFLANSLRADSIQAAEEQAAIRALASGLVPARVDTTVVTLPPGELRSVRLEMVARAWAVYSWSANGPVDDDVRGDSVNAPEGMYFRYRSGSDRSADSGAIVAKFDGRHGWLWTNRGDSNATVTLVTIGNYSTIARSDQ
jgi:hypothetical protein